MDIKPTSQNQLPWRVLGVSGESRILVAPPASVRVETLGLKAVIPMPLVILLQSEEAREFISDPAVAPFLYGASERESRIRAARMLADQHLSAKRREFVHHAKALGVSDAEAWSLARLKFPVDL